MQTYTRGLAALAAIAAASCVVVGPAMSTAGAVGVTATTTKLSASPNAAVAGQTVKFSAKIVPSVAGAVPTGTVTFTVDAVVQPAVSVVPSTKTLGDAVATISETWNSVGSHTVTAHYNGDAVYAASSSTPLTVLVGPEPTTVAVTSSLSPSVVGQSIKLYAKISEKYKTAVPTGTVTFTIDGVAKPPVPVITSHGTLSISTLTHGSHNVTAHYSGDSAHLASTSGIFVQVVN